MTKSSSIAAPAWPSAPFRGLLCGLFCGPWHNHFRARFFTLGVALLALCGGALRAAEDSRPNLVFLFTDDQCSYSLGCYGNPNVKSPNIDQLAKDGMAFDNHYDTTAICMASRANVFTGKYEFKNGCNFDTGNLLQSHWDQSYPKLLRSAGYRTAIAGKIGITVTGKPGGRGKLPEADFDRWGAGPGQTSYVTAKNPSMAKYAKEYPHSTLSYGAFARDFIADSADQGPFCLSISFKAPHRPVAPDPKFDDIYQNVRFAKPENFGREHGNHLAEQSRQGRQYARFHEWGYATTYQDVMAKYHQQVYAVDVAVGMIRKALREAGVEKNTVIIFTSDNGFLCGSHGYGSKVLPYEESSRVPLIIYDPRHANSGKHLRCQSLTGNIDVAPTLLRLAGLPVPNPMDGRNLMDLYDQPDATIHPSLQLINVWGPQKVHSLSVATKDWKYIYWPYAEGDFQPTEELFDLAKDPLELQLHNDNTERLQEMRKLYDDAVRQWLTEAVPYHGYREFGKQFQRK